MKRFCLFFCAFICWFSGFSLGEWTDYSSYASAQKVVVAGDRIYCVTLGGLFVVDKSDNSLRKLTGVNGLSDTGVQTVGYGPEAKVVVVAYENSNLDLIFEREIVNLSDIKRKQLAGDKTINNMLFVGQTVYLSCGFGIVAVNLEKREIKDTYYIGHNGADVKVADMAFDGRYLYAATEEGILKADAESDNLLDFRSWKLVEDIPNANGAFQQLEFVDGDLFAVFDGGEAADVLYRLSGDEWNVFFSSSAQIVDLQANAGFLSVSFEAEVRVYSTDGDLVERVTTYALPNLWVGSLHVGSAAADADAQGELWVADTSYGLIHKDGETYTRIVPSGPADNHVFAMSFNGADLWVASGGRNAVWNNLFFAAQFQLYREGQWQVFNQLTHPEWGGFHDVLCVAADPASPDHVFAGSWGGGVAEFRNGEFVARYHNLNSSLQTALPNQPNDPYVRISDLDFDSKGNLWVVNSLASKPLSVLRPDGEWESFALPGVQSDTDMGQMVITDSDDQWVVVPKGKGLAVRKADGTDARYLSVVAYFNNGTDEVFTQMNNIYAIALDRDGAVWVGTTVGAAVYSRPGDLWSDNTLYATQPGLDQNDGLYHPLLSTETVTAIAVDGANRKWFGTKASGVYLISDDGEQEIKHFTTANSPLLADEITSIAVNDYTGEVFIGTVKGLISYMGEATAGKANFSDVYVYPNPVREDYAGDIVITGLMDDTEVKITDISGNLVCQTSSLGGQAVWDGKNLRGNRVGTGVYLVLGNDPSGEQTFVAKILFIH